MTDAEELEKFRADKKIQLKRARRVAVVFGCLATSALIIFVYAFFQQQAANRRLAIEKRKIDSLTAEVHALEFRAQKAEAKKQAEIAFQKQIECEQKQRTSK